MNRGGTLCFWELARLSILDSFFSHHECKHLADTAWEVITFDTVIGFFFSIRVDILYIFLSAQNFHEG